MMDYRRENPLATVFFFAVFAVLFLISLIINPYLFSSKPLVQKIQVNKSGQNGFLYTYSQVPANGEGTSIFFGQGMQNAVIEPIKELVDNYPLWNGHLPIQAREGMYEKGHWFASKDGVAFYSMEKGMIEFHALSGELKWFFDSGSKVNFSSRPLILKTHAVVAGEDQTLAAFKVDTGEVQWTSISNYKINFMAYLKGDLITFSQTRDDQFLICKFKLDSGNQEACSEEQTGKILSVSHVSIPGVLEAVYATTQEGKVLAYEGSIDKPQWEFLANAAVANPPAVIDQSLLVTSETGQIVNLNRTSGEKVWEYQASESLRPYPVLVPGYNLIMLMSKSGELIALKRRSGESKWRVKTFNQSVYGGTSVVRLSSRLAQKSAINVFYGTWSLWTPCGADRFCVYNPETGQLVQRVFTHGLIAAAPIFVDDQIYVIVEKAIDVGSPEKKVKDWAVVRLSPPGPKPEVQ